MKVTMKAVLINETGEQKSIIDNLMLVFCTAIRYSFKRLLENVKINKLEKDVSKKYNLNNSLSKRCSRISKVNYSLSKRNGKYYCHITFELPKTELMYTGNNGIIGIDTNPDGSALTMIDNKGNYKWQTYVKQHELLYARTNRRETLCGS